MGRSRLVAAGALASLFPATAVGQHRHDVQLHALLVASEAEFYGAGLGAGWRVGRRLRLAVTVSGGSREGRAAGRGEGLAIFLVNPRARGGAVVYGGGGVAGTLAAGAVDERLVVLVGVEGPARRRNGWFVELGVGGGVRAAAGVRHRFGPAR